MSESQEVSPIHVPSSEETALEELFRNAEFNRTSQLDSSDSMGDRVESEEKERRLAKNREHARSCRSRKKAMIQTLRDTVGSLSEANQELKSQNEALQKKVQALEEVLINHVQQLNFAQAATPNFQSNSNNLHDLLRRREMISNVLKTYGSNQPLPFQPSIPSVLPLQDDYRSQNFRINIPSSGNRASTLSQNLGNLELLAALKRERAQNLDSQTYFSNASAGSDIARPRV
eukprot:CAMPEP_0113315608 /NCGR_PEP_ID=MMETSP0010_2-20120614/11209_1 /TAXON_ID=216773 ORGANISM="Corethron hystrix, Strain 308" /NCGR_SAMPLE_ID=MMETSP0010_2 /ASSEMBLY_ACC=CAM_ASM_000155 /LENGTH=230 /DNA_ID=CAMNT_0000172145 /DNA_START=194 /DNA_END=886 /DNA_ORIENTATION=+ /assembly_acc=CAM_ASM_000155